MANVGGNFEFQGVSYVEPIWWFDSNLVRSSFVAGVPGHAVGRVLYDLQRWPGEPLITSAGKAPSVLKFAWYDSQSTPGPMDYLVAPS